MRQEINEQLGIIATDNYGLSEVMGPGVAGECQECNGLHINEDHFLCEIIDPDTLEPVRPGRGRRAGDHHPDQGGLSGHPLPHPRPDPAHRRALPLRPHPEADERVMGRTDDMLIIKGVNVFPTQIEQVLFEIEGTEPHYQIVVERENRLDKITVLVEVVESIFFDEMKKQREMIETHQAPPGLGTGHRRGGQAGGGKNPGAHRRQGETGDRQTQPVEDKNSELSR